MGEYIKNALEELPPTHFLVFRKYYSAGSSAGFIFVYTFCTSSKSSSKPTILSMVSRSSGFTSSICFDFEVYSEAQKRWLEVSSVSNFDTYQANRLHCRYRRASDKKIELCHTLNGSALALPRIVAALLEDNQTPEGIRIPKALVPYTGFDMITND